MYDRRMLPMDVIRLIVNYSSLKVRYCWSLVCKDFKMTDYEWSVYGRQFSLLVPTKENVRGLCQREYVVQNKIAKYPHHLWSEHLCEPLKVWSPWTPSRFCQERRGANGRCSGVFIFFRKYSFIDFIRRLKNQFQLSSSCFRVFQNRQGITVNVHSRQMPMVYICSVSKRRIRKIHMTSAFKSTKSVRALIAFHIAAGHLYLKVRRLEFLT